MNCKKQDEEEENIAIAGDARRLIVKSGSFQTQKKRKNERKKSKGINKFSYLMLF